VARKSDEALNTPGERIAIVAGLRTPFARQLTAYSEMSAIQLGVLATTELMARLDLDPALVERMAYGQVGIQPEAPNIAREVVLGSGLLPSTDAYSISRACATSFQTTADIAQAIRLGEIEVGMAGGADSASVLPIQVSRKLAQALIHASRAKTLGQKLRLFRGHPSQDLLPRPPAVRRTTPPISAWGISPNRWPKSRHRPGGAGQPRPALPPAGPPGLGRTASSPKRSCRNRAAVQGARGAGQQHTRPTRARSSSRSCGRPSTAATAR
jgi:hypothetical protein